MKNYTKYLIVRGDGGARITTRYPYHLKNNEIAYRVAIHVPDAWGRLMNEGIDLTLPNNPPTVDGVSDL